MKRKRFPHEKDNCASRALKSRETNGEFPLINVQFRPAFRTYHDHCFILFGNQTFMVSSPMRNPPKWANHATPPAFWSPELIMPFKNCMIAQNPITINAGIFTVVIKKPKKSNVCTFARGKSRIYAPRIPETAPLAPIIGMVESGLVSAWAYAAQMPQKR